MNQTSHASANSASSASNIMDRHRSVTHKVLVAIFLVGLLVGLPVVGRITANAALSGDHMNQVALSGDHMNEVALLGDHMNQVALSGDHMNEVALLGDHMNQVALSGDHMNQSDLA